jgi:hypothetical protein
MPPGADIIRPREATRPYRGDSACSGREFKFHDRFGLAEYCDRQIKRRVSSRIARNGRVCPSRAAGQSSLHLVKPKPAAAT